MSEKRKWTYSDAHTRTPFHVTFVSCGAFPPSTYTYFQHPLVEKHLFHSRSLFSRRRLGGERAIPGFLRPLIDPPNIKVGGNGPPGGNPFQKLFKWRRRLRRSTSRTNTSKSSRAELNIRRWCPFRGAFRFVEIFRSLSALIDGSFFGSLKISVIALVSSPESNGARFDGRCLFLVYYMSKSMNYLSDVNRNWPVWFSLCNSRWNL